MAGSSHLSLKYLALLVISLKILPSPAWCLGNGTNMTLEELMEHLFHPDRYNKKIRPGANDGKSSEVAIGMYVHSLSAVSELNMEYTIDMYFRQFWNDPRLAFNHSYEYITLDSFFRFSIWLPDPYFMNSKDEHFHTVTVPNIMIRIDGNGDVFYSQRLSLILSCNMDLRKFPMDAQICDIRIMSYAFNTKDIVLTWQGVTISDEVELPEYDVSEDIDMGDCTQTYISGTYSCLVGNFTLTRRLSYYVVQTYIPSILIVVLSWVNFWLDASATPARVCLGLLCVLTMTTQNSGILSTLPRVSYVKSIDVWSSACLVFVFGALLEFAVVNVQCRKMELLEKKKSKLNLVTNGAQSDDPEKDQKFCFKPVVVTAERVDFLSRIIFPSSFAIFNLVYWQKYLIENVG